MRAFLSCACSRRLLACRWAWIGCFIIYCIVLGLGGRGDYDVNRLTPTMDEGRELTGDVLSFLGIMFSVVRSLFARVDLRSDLARLF